MNLGGDGPQIQNRSLLAGVGAAAMAVLIAVPLLFWMVWHRIAVRLAPADMVMIVAITVVCGGVRAVRDRGAGVAAATRMFSNRRRLAVRYTVRATCREQPASPARYSVTVGNGVAAGGSHIHSTSTIRRAAIAPCGITDASR